MAFLLRCKTLIVAKVIYTIIKIPPLEVHHHQPRPAMFQYAATKLSVRGLGDRLR
jgi:hypothetical protein